MKIECNYMDCENEVTQPHPDYPDDKRLCYCDEHYDYIKSIRSGADRGDTDPLKSFEEELDKLYGQDNR